MSNNSIPDWKKAAVVGMSQKYGDRAIGRRLDINYKTARKYRKQAEKDGKVEMDGINMEVNE